MRTALFALAPALLLLILPVAHGQSLGPPAAHQGGIDDQGSAGAAIVAGLGLGLAGFLVGGLTAASTVKDCPHSEGPCSRQLEAAFYGAATGGTFGMALGVHLGNHRRGNLALDFLTGAAVWGAGVGIAAASGWDTGVTVGAFVAIPIIQLASTVKVERAVGRSRARRLSVFVAPQRSGRTTFGASVPF
jgi:hypothetical protein